MCTLRDYKGDPVTHLHCRLCGKACWADPCLACVWAGRDQMDQDVIDEEDF